MLLGIYLSVSISVYIIYTVYIYIYIVFAVSFDELHNEVDWTGYDCVDQRPVAGAGAKTKD